MKTISLKPTFNTDLWRWEIGGEYCSPEKALSILGMAFYAHQKELAQAAGYPGIIAMLDAKHRAAWNRSNALATR